MGGGSTFSLQNACVPSSFLILIQKRAHKVLKKIRQLPYCDPGVHQLKYAYLERLGVIEI